MTKFFDYLLRHFLFFLPDKLYLSLLYRIRVGVWINWKNPTTFTEKIQWLKVYSCKPEYTTMVDKLSVKDYVADRIGKQYIIPTLGVWNSVEEIDWDSLPNQFVLKTTHGGGGCGVVICHNKNIFDKKKAIKKLAKSMAGVVGKEFRERPYYNVSRKIFAEKYMEDSPDKITSQNGLTDYKFFCFNGEPLYCQVIRDRNTKETIDFYDMEWNHMPFVGLNPVVKNGQKPVIKPTHLNDLVKICRKLSENVPFVRVDMYVMNDKEYFGEITFYPAGGLGQFYPNSWNNVLGNLIELSIN